MLPLLPLPCSLASGRVGAGGAVVFLVMLSVMLLADGWDCWLARLRVAVRLEADAVFVDFDGLL